MHILKLIVNDFHILLSFMTISTSYHLPQNMNFSGRLWEIWDSKAAAWG